MGGAKVLVTGGAGYIGSHAVKALLEAGHRTVTLDNLVYGHRELLPGGDFIEGDLRDEGLLKQVFETHRFDAVMHFAAYAYVGESEKDPGKYYDNNVRGAVSLLRAMGRAGVSVMVFSSTCAVYGEPVRTPIPEDHPRCPINPYGRTKLAVEWMLEDFEKAHGLRSARLRYFNAAGADPSGELGEDHDPETHLIPLVLDAALGRRERVEIYGRDYDTPDGTCIRDYVHVADLAAAHVLSLERLLDGGPGLALNLGNGAGYSVKEVIETAREVTGRPIRADPAPRRPGDPSRLVGGSRKARETLGWQPKYPGLEAIVETAWRWHRRRFG